MKAIFYSSHRFELIAIAIKLQWQRKSDFYNKGRPIAWVGKRMGYFHNHEEML